MTLEIQEVVRAMNGRGNPLPATVTGWSVDTRTQNPGDVYFALRGPNHDGHDFLGVAMEKGAAAVVVESEPSRDRHWPLAGKDAVIVVDDTLRALQELAAWARGKWDGTVIGVTGSAGKTTTKDAIAHLLAGEMPVGKTIGNLNN